MTDPLKALLDAGVLNTSAFPENSRYHGIGVATYQPPGGEPVVHLKRRFVPDAGGYVVIREHTVSEGDRVDNLAAQHLGDPQLYWRLCDANTVMHPEQLTERVGDRVAITLPEGVPGKTDAG